MLTSNHKKLVNACYPLSVKHKNTSSISPDSNSLSKLVYYCSTRPHKIQKITTYLLSYAQSQALPSSFTSSLSVYRNSKPGLICTIKIFKALLENHTINLALLAPHLNSIIAIGLGLFNRSFSSNPFIPLHPPHKDPPPSKDQCHFGSDWVSQDLDITLLTIDLFSSFAESIQLDCLQDDRLAHNYLFFLAKFSSIAMVCPSTSSIINSLKLPSSKPKPARCMALMALESSIKAPSLYSSSYFDRQIRMILPGLMAPIIPGPQRDPDELFKIIHQAHLEPSQETSKPSTKNELLGEIKDLRSIVSKLQNSESRLPTEFDLIKYSVKILHYLLTFQLTNLNQFEICVNGILKQIESSISSNLSECYNWFGKSLLAWAIPKYRSIVIDLVVDRLTVIDSNQNQPHQSSDPKALVHQPAPDRQQEFQKMLILAGMLKAMLNDPIARSIQLLNTPNIIHQLLRLIRSILKPGNQLNHFQANLRDLLVKVIGSLVHTVYYTELIYDICKDLLSLVKSIIQSSSSENGLITETNEARSFDPTFLIVLFESLEMVLTNSTSRLASTSQAPKTSTLKREHYPNSLLLWKDSLSILDDLKDHHECRHAYLRTLMSYLKSDAFSMHLTFLPPDGDDQHLTQFLSALNIAVYREQISNVIGQPDFEIAFVSSFEPKSSDTTRSTPETPKLKDSNPHAPNPSSEPPSKGPIKVNDALPNQKVEITLGDCMLEIQSRQQSIGLLTCLPMLQQLDGVMAREANKSSSNWSKPFSTNTFSNSSHLTTASMRNDDDFVLKCLKTIGRVWGIEEQIQAAIQIQGSSEVTHDATDEDVGERDGTRVSSFRPRQIRWDKVLESICCSSIVQEESGLAQAELEVQLNRTRWSIQDARELAGFTATSSNHSTRRLSMTNILPYQQQQQRRKSRVVPAITSSYDHDDQPSSRPRTPPPSSSMRKSIYLSTLLSKASPSDSLPSSLKSPSVSDLRNSLLGVGFRPSSTIITGELGAKRNTSISAHSSLVMNTTTIDLNHHSITAPNSTNNHSIGDLSKYPDTRQQDLTGFILATSISELGVMRDRHEQSHDHSNAFNGIDSHDSDRRKIRNELNPNDVGLNNLLKKKSMDRRRMLMERRKTLTSEILEKSRRNLNPNLGSSLNSSVRIHRLNRAKSSDRHEDCEEDEEKEGDKKKRVNELERRRNGTFVSSRSLPHHLYSSSPSSNYLHPKKDEEGIGEDPKDREYRSLIRHHQANQNFETKPELEFNTHHAITSTSTIKTAINPSFISDSPSLVQDQNPSSSFQFNPSSSPLTPNTNTNTTTPTSSSHTHNTNSAKRNLFVRPPYDDDHDVDVDVDHYL